MKGALRTSAVSRIEMVHPIVNGAENISYQIWPVDNTTSWTTRFGELNMQKRRWRMVKTMKALSNKLGGMELAKEEAKEKGRRKRRRKRKSWRRRKRRNWPRCDSKSEAQLIDDSVVEAPLWRSPEVKSTGKSDDNYSIRMEEGRVYFCDVYRFCSVGKRRLS